MATVSINGRFYETELIAFDKDGTLIDFHALWGRRAYDWIEALVAQGKNAAALQADFYDTLGFVAESGRVLAESPLAVASLPALYTLAAGVFFRHGLGWHEAETAVAHTHTVATAPPDPVHVEPLGKVTETIHTLKAAGIRIAVITADGRASTEATLKLLNIDKQVDALICGDDPPPIKPDPEALWQLGNQFGVAPKRMLMVGDTVSDMRFGQTAGVGGCVGVTGGAGRLAGETAVVIPSIDAIQLV